MSWRIIVDVVFPYLDRTNDSLEISESDLHAIELPKLIYAGRERYFESNEHLTYISALVLKNMGQGISIVNSSKLANPLLERHRTLHVYRNVLLFSLF